MSHLKLGVEVHSAHGLMAKDGQGSASPFVELHFDHQKVSTTVKEKDLDPYWNETFYFNISDPNHLSNLTLDAYVYNRTRGNDSKSFMGKVHIHGTSFVPYSDSVVFQYPLEKRSIFSRVKGELGLKVFITDNPSVRSSNQLPQMDTSSHGRKESKDSIKTFHHLPNSNFNQQPQYPSSQPYIAPMNQPQYGGHDMRNQNQSQFESQVQSQPKVVRMYSGSSSQPMEYSLKETSPFLGGGQVVRGRVVARDNRRSSTYDLVEPMQYLFVRVVKAQDLPSMDVTGSLDPFVEVRIGNYKGITQHFSKTSSPEWNVVFAFSRERMQASVLDVVVKDKDMIKDDFVGIVRVNLHDIPTRVPPDSPLAPEWYRLEDKNGEKRRGELMLAVWIGTQADEAFPDAFLVDQARSSVDSAISSIYLRSKVYQSPRLWYVRVNVIEVQDLVWTEKHRFPEVYVRAHINNQALRTRPVQARNGNALWNEDMMFVAAEPFEDHLVLNIEDRGGHNKEEILGKVFIPLNSVERRADDRNIQSRWFNLQHPGDYEADDKAEKMRKREKFATRLHLRICLDGGYHVLDESTQYSSDLRPTAKQLWRPSIGILELGILNATALHPMKTREGRGTTDAYCVAKYGHKWIRTRTVVDSLTPKFNEQYTWEVHDPSTVLTLGVFDNTQLDNDSNSRDVRIGKIRIRISTLETGRVYTHSYPLLVLHPSGVKKMGEVHLAIRFSSTSMMNMMYMYSKPLLPKMHYVRPLTVVQLEMLRHQAVGIVAARLSRAEPPLRREVVEYMTDANSHLWSMRRSKANFFRLMSVFNGVFAVSKWFGEICMWKNPVTTVLVHVLFVMLVSFPELILPTVFVYMFLIGLWNYWFRAQYPPHMNTRLSYADGVNPDELDEEFDTFPTSRSPDMVRHRYDRLRSVAGRIQSVVGDIASQGERLQGLLSWRDPRATLIFMIFCLVAAFVLYATPFQVLVILTGFYVMRHPRFRHRLPSAPLNFFRRLPARTDSML